MSIIEEPTSSAAGTTDWPSDQIAFWSVFVVVFVVLGILVSGLFLYAAGIGLIPWLIGVLRLSDTVDDVYQSLLGGGRR